MKKIIILSLLFSAPLQTATVDPTSIMQIPRDIQNSFFNGTAGSPVYKKKMWIYQLVNAFIQPEETMLPRIKGITKESILDMCRANGTAEIRIADRYQTYQKALDYVKVQFFNSKSPRHFSSLTVADLQRINQCIDNADEPSPVRSAPIMVFMEPFSNALDLCNETVLSRCSYLSDDEKVAVKNITAKPEWQNRYNTMGVFTVHEHRVFNTAIAKVVDTTCPKGDEVEIQLKELISIINAYNPDGPTHPICLAAYVFGRICCIHPFADGNGRTALLVANLILIQSGYLPMLCAKERYVNAVDAFIKTKNYNILICYFALNLLIVGDFYRLSDKIAVTKEELNYWETRPVTDVYSKYPYFFLYFLTIRHCFPVHRMLLKKNLITLFESEEAAEDLIKDFCFKIKGPE